MRNPAQTRALLQTASNLRDQGRFAEAAQSYEAALREAPELATAWYNLGFCQKKIGRFEAALASYRQAIAHGLEGAEEAHLNRAVIFADVLRREQDAELELHAALARNPNYLPALLNLANLAEDFGRRDEARALYERALAVDPNAHEALARRANVLSSAYNLGAEIDALRAALRRGADARDAASLGFALGRLLDVAGQYEEAFEAYAQANAASRRAYGQRYDRAAASAAVERIIAAFPEARPAVEAEAWAPIFICGMFRSGSTLTEQILAGHARVQPGGEFYALPHVLGPALAAAPEQAASLDAAACAKLAAAYRAQVRAVFPGADLITDKWLANYMHVGLIKRMFPAAKIVHTVRAPLDNVLSVYFLHLDPTYGYACDLGDIAHEVALSRRLMAHWQTLYPEDVVTFDYDAFVAEPAASAKALAARLDLDWQEPMLAFHERDNAVKTASVWQVREPLYTRSSGRWRNYARHLAGLDKAGETDGPERSA